MARAAVKTLIDFDNTALKRRFVQWAGTLRGIYDVKVEPKRAVRSLRQNAYWHGVVVESFAEFLRQQEFSLSSHDAAHELLKEKFLRVPVADPNGEVVGYVTRSTASLTTEEFAGLVDAACAWLAEQFGIIVPEPDVCRGLSPEGARK